MGDGLEEDSIVLIFHSNLYWASSEVLLLQVLVTKHQELWKLFQDHLLGQLNFIKNYLIFISNS
ncbi:hypothetical protein C0J52_02317 [Blattella germanica]|nr:hypothetical protein C0J52_02317 [Blattella germanica]